MDVKILTNKIDSERCHVKLLDLYFKKLPHDAKGKDVFYLRPLSATPSDLSQPWFMSTSVGKNILDKCNKNFKFSVLVGTAINSTKTSS